MKVKDLKDKETNLTKIKVRLPDDVFQKYKDYCGGEQEMWIGGFMMGDFFMSIDTPTEKKRKLFSMPEGVETKDILEWEIIENLNEIENDNSN